MLSKKEKLIARILFIPATGFFVFLLFNHLGKPLNDVIYNLTEDNYSIFLRFDSLAHVVFWVSIIWILLHFTFEITAYLSENFPFKRLLTNLRYAPIAIFIFSGFIIPIYDAGMIAYSKWQIKNYVFSSSQSIEEPVIKLHNDYRHWCGNGAMGRRKDLYFETAIEGIESENPKTRIRSWLMAYDVWDFFNGSKSERLDVILKKGCNDSDSNIRNIAENFLKWRQSDCQKFLLSKSNLFDDSNFVGNF